MQDGNQVVLRARLTPQCSSGTRLCWQHELFFPAGTWRAGGRSQYWSCLAEPPPSCIPVLIQVPHWEVELLSVSPRDGISDTAMMSPVLQWCNMLEFVLKTHRNISWQFSCFFLPKTKEYVLRVRVCSNSKPQNPQRGFVPSHLGSMRESRDAVAHGWKPGKRRLCRMHLLPEDLPAQTRLWHRDVGPSGQRGRWVGHTELCKELREFHFLLHLWLNYSLLWSRREAGREFVGLQMGVKEFCQNLHSWMMSQQWLVQTFSFWWLTASSLESFRLKIGREEVYIWYKE